MEDEMVDLIDENDKVIGTEKKIIAVKNNLLRRVSHTFILNQKGQLLIQKRSLKCDIRPGKFTSSSSGHVMAGEGYESAAHRELKEELGMDTELEFVKKFRIKDECTNSICSFFIGKTNDAHFNIDKDELNSVRYMDIDSLNEDIKRNPDLFGNTFKEAFKIYQEAK